MYQAKYLEDYYSFNYFKEFSIQQTPYITLIIYFISYNILMKYFVYSFKCGIYSYCK